MPYKYAKLRGRIVEKYGTAIEFAKVLETTNNTVSRKLNGESGFSQQDIVKWSEHLMINPDQIGEYFFA